MTAETIHNRIATEIDWFDQNYFRINTRPAHIEVYIAGVGVKQGLKVKDE